jgi:xanthosine utilization system XapX-like protein
VQWKFNALGTVGLRLGGACAAYYWTGWLAWSAAGFTALYAEYHLRVPAPPANYLIEAVLGILLPYCALVLGDHVSLESYMQVWFDLRRPGCAPQMLDVSAVERIRADLGSNVLLRWFRPPVSKELSTQLVTTALWYKAMALHPSRGFWARYGEWVVDVMVVHIAVLGIVAVAYLWLVAEAGKLDWLLHVALLGMCLPLMVTGYSVIRFAARRQAILDYFRTWRLDADEFEQASAKPAAPVSPR